MSWGPEDFARYYFSHFSRKATRKEPVYATLLRHPLHGVTIKEINIENGWETDDPTIEETRRVLREISDLLETYTRKNSSDVGRTEIVYRPGKLLDSYRDPTLSYVLSHEFDKGREESLDPHIRAAVRCNEPPAVCPDSCKNMTCFRDEKRNSDKLV